MNYFSIWLNLRELLDEPWRNPSDSAEAQRASAAIDTMSADFI